MGSTLDEDTLRRHAAYLEGIFTYDELANLPRVDNESLWYSVEAWFRKYVQERRWIREYSCMYRGERSLAYEATVDEFTERITYPFFTTPNCRVATYYAMDGPVYKLCIRPGTRYWFFSKLRVVERTNRLCHIFKCAIAGMSGSEMLDECMAESTTRDAGEGMEVDQGGGGQGQGGGGAGAQGAGGGGGGGPGGPLGPSGSRRGHPLHGRGGAVAVREKGQGGGRGGRAGKGEAAQGGGARGRGGGGGTAAGQPQSGADANGLGLGVPAAAAVCAAAGAEETRDGRGVGGGGRGGAGPLREVGGEDEGKAG